jgi:hypothetical protein
MRKNYDRLILFKSGLCNLFAIVFLISIMSLLPQHSIAKNFYYEAPDKNVTGKVTDDKGAALSNVTILLKGTKKGVTSDLNGSFSISVPDDNAILVISYIGYKTQEITVGSQSNLTVTLTVTSENLTDVVVVGYGTQKKVTVTGAVSAIKGRSYTEISCC